MYYGNWVLRDCKSRYNSLLKNIDHEIKRQSADFKEQEDKDLVIEEGYKEILPRFNSIFMDFSSAIQELCNFNLDRGYSTILKFTKKMINDILQEANRKENRLSMQQIKTRADEIFTSFDDYNYNNTYSGDMPYAYRCKYQNKKLFIDTDLMQKVLSHVKINSTRPITMFHPIFYSSIDSSEMITNYGDLMHETLNDKKYELKMYGNPYSSSILSYINRDSYSRIAIGDNSVISNDTFDILFFDPIITTDVPSHNFGVVIRDEYVKLRNNMIYLRSGGWAIITIPFYRISSLANYLAKNLEDVHVFRNEDKAIEDNYFGEVYIVGRKKSAMNRELDANTYNFLRSFYTDEIFANNKFDINNEEYKDFNMQLSSEIKEVKTFRTGILDEAQIKKEGTSIDHFKEFFNRQKSDKEMFKEKQPLLPFNVGQIGLVLTSGCLDGLVEEEDNACHVVKGRIVKSTAYDSSTTNNIITNTQTVSNHVEINVFLPDGTRKILA